MVVRARHVAPCNLVGVLAGAHWRLAARHRHAHRLVARKGHARRRTGRQGRGGLAECRRAVSRQGRAVVFLAVRARHDRQRSRSHTQLTFCLRHAGIVASRIITSGIR